MNNDAIEGAAEVDRGVARLKRVISLLEEDVRRWKLSSDQAIRARDVAQVAHKQMATERDTAIEQRDAQMAVRRRAEADRDAAKQALVDSYRPRVIYHTNPVADPCVTSLQVTIAEQERDAVRLQLKTALDERDQALRDRDSAQAASNRLREEVTDLTVRLRCAINERDEAIQRVSGSEVERLKADKGKLYRRIYQLEATVDQYRMTVDRLRDVRGSMTGDTAAILFKNCELGAEWQ